MNKKSNRTTPHRWEIPDPNRTLDEVRRKVKSYAAAHDLPIAEALREIVNLALGKQKSISMDRPPHGATDGVQAVDGGDREQSGTMSTVQRRKPTALGALSQATARPTDHPTQRPTSGRGKS